MVGELIADRYELEELVGSGGMSSVYRAHDSLLERHVALKVMHEQLLGEGDQVERFRREARLAAQLSHPNIVTVIDRGEQQGRQFIVFEYVEGENLKALIERESPLPEREAIRVALQVAEGLSFAHAHGLVHRDVKPQNVLLTEDGRAKVTDFGIARSTEVHHGLTRTGTVMGTSDYISPEQARGGQVDASSDIYALGAVLYELLTGDVPFHGDNFVSVAMRHINDPPPSVREQRPELSPRLDAAIRRAMAKDPDDRFPTMDAFAAELRACLAERDGAAFGPLDQTLIVPGARRRRRPVRGPMERPTVWPLILLLGGLAVLAGVFAVVFALTGSPTKFGPALHKATGGATRSAPVQLSGLSGYDPFGTGGEHDEDARLATDGQQGTFWETEHYNSSLSSLDKPGVGLLLDAGSVRKVSQVTVTSDTPGFTAEIQAGPSSAGPFRPVSGTQTVGASTSFTIHNARARYFVVWITDLGQNASVHVNEVTAKS
ncbi:MAG TPA: protein kinase [Gaiellaceae bacterium]|nr:protein kinase [Gaiellaceae bacterium]